MSSADRFVRQHRFHTDCAISQAYARLGSDACARARFSDLLQAVRQRAPRLLEARGVNGRHPGVVALFNLARCAESHLRPLARWDGCPRAWRPAIGALAHHLVGRYEVPAFLTAAWYAAEGPLGDAKRRWFMAHASGARIRSLDLPIELTSKMEHIFLGSPAHLTIERAMRRAELIGLGVPDWYVEPVLATRLGWDLTNGPFWRTLWQLLIAYPTAIPPAQIGPIVDFLQHIRHAREAPQPYFSLKGRTPPSLLRLIDGWHRGLWRVSGGLSWDPSRLRPMSIAVPREDQSKPPLRYDFVELLDAEQLRAEGAALHHCVATYSRRCWSGASRIWSLRSTLDRRVKSVITLEVDVATRAIIQARGYRNRLPTGRARELIAQWAARERLQLRM